MKSILRLAFMILGVAAVQFSFAQELMNNKGLESWTSMTVPEFWDKAESTEQDAVSPQEGTYSAKIVATGTRDLAQIVTGIAPGDEVTISFWYKVSAGDNTSARIWSYWEQGDGTNINDNANELRGPNNAYLDNNGGEWTQYSTTLTAPALTEQLNFEVRTYSGATVNWDDFSVFKVANTCPLSITIDSVVCDAVTPGMDPYTAYVSFTGGGQGGGTYTITPAPTGDDPNTMASGQFTISETEGTDITLDITSSDCSISENITSPTCIELPDLVINEIQSDPDATNGDANMDGNVSTSQDEFVELFNNDDMPIDLSGWTISDAVAVRHTFPAGTVLPVGGYLVVFGGGTPDTMNLPGDIIQTASGGFLGLNNGGDDVIIATGSGTEVVSHTYGGEAGDNQSIGRDPDTTGMFVKHTTIMPTGRLFSPGEENSQISSCTLVTSVDSVVCGDSTFNDDAYMVYVGFTGGGQGLGTYTISPTNSGDDPNTMASGTMVFMGTENTDVDVDITSADCMINFTVSSPACLPAVACANPGDIIVTEFMANPGDVSDGIGEYIEFYNRSSETYNLAGYLLQDQGSDSHEISGSLPIGPGEFVVVANSDTLGMVVDYVYSGFSLSNGGDEIILRCPDSTLVVSVNYTNGDPFGSGVAVELECIDVPGFMFTIDNFVAATDEINYDMDADTDFGSPGALGNTVSMTGAAALLISEDVPASSASGVTVSFTVCGTDTDSISPCGYDDDITLTQTAGEMATITDDMITAVNGCATFEVLMPMVNACDTIKFVATTDTLESDTFSILVKQLIHAEDFTCATQTWSVQNVDGQQTWECDTVQGFVSCNTFGDTTTMSEDWIISPALDLSSFEAISMNFRTRERFNGPVLELLYSEDYSGTGDPNAATWTALTFNYDDSQNGFAFAPWTGSGDVTLPATGASTHVAFKYTADIDTSMTSAANWLVDDMVISGCPKNTGGLVINELYNDQSFTGSTCGSHVSYIELLAVATLDDTTATTVNAQNWIIEPSTGEGGHARIKAGCLTDIPVGALVVIYNADNVHPSIPGADETDSDDDMIYYVPSNSSCLEYTSEATYPGTTYTSGDDGSCTHANQISALFSVIPITAQTRNNVDATVFDELSLTAIGSSSMDCNNISDDSAVIHGTTATPGAANTTENGIIIAALQDEAMTPNPDAINYVNYLTSGLTPMCGEIVEITCVDTLVLTGPMMVADTFLASDAIETMGAVIASNDLVFDAPVITLGPNFEIPLGIEFTTLLNGCTAVGGRQANIQVIRVIDGVNEEIIDLRDREE